MFTATALPDYSEIEIQNIVFLHVRWLKENFHFEDLEFYIQSVQLFGSRIFAFQNGKVIKCKNPKGIRTNYAQSQIN